jgi:hypothetical protein
MTLLVALTSSQPLHAGLAAALADAFDASDADRLLVEPSSLLDVEPRIVAAATLVYSPRDGNLSAELPPLALSWDIQAGRGQWRESLEIRSWRILHQVAGLEIESDSLDFDVADAAPPRVEFLHAYGPSTARANALNRLPTDLRWETAPGGTASYEVTADRITWLAELGDSPFGDQSDAEPLPRILAARVDFGPVLPAGLSNAQLRATLTSRPGQTLAHYANHRNVVNFSADVLATVVPEPSSWLLALGPFWAALLVRGFGRRN